jgi:hypothetical protein
MAPAVENAPVRGQHMQSKTKQNKQTKQTNKQQQQQHPQYLVSTSFQTNNSTK